MCDKMPEALQMNEKKIYLGGRIVSYDRARLSVLDRGLNYGDGLFETIKATSGQAQYLDDHLDRLRRGALALGFSKKSIEPLLNDISNGAIEKLLKANGLDIGAKTACVKIVVTRGPSERGLLPPSPVKPSFIMTAGEVDEKAMARLRSKGVNAIISKGPCPALPGVKTLNCLPGVLARMEAKKAGAEEAIFTGPGMELLEATGANLFIVERGVLKTPPVNEDPYGPGVLPGVTRKAVFALAGALGIRLMAQRLFKSDLERCAEAFLTNSVKGIVPLVQADGAPIGDGRPGPVTRALQKTLHPLKGKAGRSAQS